MTWGDLQKLLGQAGQKVGQVVQGAQNAVQQGEQAVGSQLAQTPTTPIPGSPTWQQVGQAVTQNPVYQKAQQFRQANNESGYQNFKQSQQKFYPGASDDQMRQKYDKFQQGVNMVMGTMGGDMAVAEAGPRSAAQVVADRGKFTTNIPQRTNTYAPQVEELPNPGETALTTAPQPPTTTAKAAPPQPTFLPEINQQNFLTKAGNAIKSDVGKVVAPDAKNSLYGAEHTADIQGALLRNKVDNYSQLPQAARNIYEQKINPELAANPKSVPLDSVTNQIVTEMRKMQPGLNQLEAHQAAHGVINDLYNVARNNGGENVVVPDSIDTPSLFGIRQRLNDTAAVNKYFNDVPLSNMNELATVASRKALSDVIAQYHPAIAQATKDYGLLKEAVPSLAQAASKGRDLSLNLPVGLGGQPFQVSLPSVIAGPIRDITGGALRGAGAVAGTPIGKAVAAGGLIAGGTALGMSPLPGIVQGMLQQKGQSGASSNVGTQPNNVANNSDVGNQVDNTIPSSFGNLKKDDQGFAQLPTSMSQTPIQGYYPLSQYLQDVKNLDPHDPFYSQKKSQLDAQKSASDTATNQYISAHQLNGNEQQFMQDAPVVDKALKQVYGEMKNTPPGVINAVKQVKDLQAYNSGQYAKLYQDVSQLQSMGPQLVNMGIINKDQLAAIVPQLSDSPTQAQTKIVGLQNLIADYYSQRFVPYTLINGGIPNAPTNSYSGDTTQGLPQTQSTPSNNYTPGTGGGVNNQLPPIVDYNKVMGMPTPR